MFSFYRFQRSRMRSGFRVSRLCAWQSPTLALWTSCSQHHQIQAATAALETSVLVRWRVAEPLPHCCPIHSHNTTYRAAEVEHPAPHRNRTFWKDCSCHFLQSVTCEKLLLWLSVLISGLKATVVMIYELIIDFCSTRNICRTFM